ncbi:cell surface receptor IPT TIG domain-containing protein [Fusarium napiforme]|uniref:Cell surface receptor IPT TIG domain-containing protein n=1 Tax=Fusarium napiforme TaxID=42672 RepID=A0A8H5N323_9HYPO|nr:cell surface receptor IPT TIG domain-containing protein [Fusarium napiforme]
MQATIIEVQFAYSHPGPFERAMVHLQGWAEMHRNGSSAVARGQPNYTFLRLDYDYIQPDILYTTELRKPWPAEFNSRFTDLSDHENRSYKARQGVYLHWTLPRLYRSSIVAADKKAATSREHAEALE